MKDIKATIARNIASLRKAQGMTQLTFAEKLNYSDKAVSKWERGESLPDIAVLVEIADLFGVPLDTLVREEDPLPKEKTAEAPACRHDHGMITAASLLLVLLAAILLFIGWTLFTGSMHPAWMTFIYALPIAMIVWLVFNSIWFNPRRNYLIVSLLMWTLLLAVYLSVVTLPMSWLTWLPGIPGQLIICVWSGFNRPKEDADLPEADDGIKE